MVLASPMLAMEVFGATVVMMVAGATAMVHGVMAAVAFLGIGETASHSSPDQPRDPLESGVFVASKGHGRPQGRRQ